MTQVHIHAPKGYYLGQIRKPWGRQWETVSKDLTDGRTAMAVAVLRMTKEHHKARVIFVTIDGYYDPHVVMEAKR